MFFVNSALSLSFAYNIFFCSFFFIKDNSVQISVHDQVSVQTLWMYPVWPWESRRHIIIQSKSAWSIGTFLFLVCEDIHWYFTPENFVSCFAACVLFFWISCYLSIWWEKGVSQYGLDWGWSLLTLFRHTLLKNPVYSDMSNICWAVKNYWLHPSL